MDGFLLVLWAVRLLFLALLYLFLARVVRALLRDLRAAAREPGDRPGRLVVLESPGGEPAAGPVVRARRHHAARSRRQQRDRHRRSVRVGRARGPDLPRPELVRRGPRQHERLVRQRPAGRRRRAARVRRRAPDRPGPDPPRTARSRMTADAPRAVRPRRACRASSARSARGRAGRRRGCSRSSRSRWSSAASRWARRLGPASFAAATTPRPLAIYLAALPVGPRRPGARRPADRPDPAAGHRVARRHLAAADGAAAAGPRHPAFFGTDVRARPRSS